MLFPLRAGLHLYYGRKYVEYTCERETILWRVSVFLWEESLDVLRSLVVGGPRAYPKGLERNGDVPGVRVRGAPGVKKRGADLFPTVQSQFSDMRHDFFGTYLAFWASFITFQMSNFSRKYFTLKSPDWSENTTKKRKPSAAASTTASVASQTLSSCFAAWVLSLIQQWCNFKSMRG